MASYRGTALLLLSAVAVLGPLWAGGVPAAAQAAAAAVCGLSLLLAALGVERPRLLRPGPAFLAPALVALAAALQCVPLPGVLVRLLSPVSWELRTFPPASTPAFAPLTLDWPATAASLAPALAVACALAAAGLLARETNARLLLGTLPVLAATVQASLALWRLATAGTLAGSFGNRNHLAALLVVGALCALGAALEPPPRDVRAHEEAGRPERLLWGAAAVLCSAVALLTASRGASVSLVAGAVLLLVLLRRSVPASPARSRVRRARRSAAGPVPGLALVLISAAVAATLVAPAGGLRRLTALPEGFSAEVKLQSFLGAALVARDHWLAGAGRGVWRLVSERHRSVPGDMAFVYVENEPLQLAAEVGLPWALLVLVCAWVAFAAALKRADGGLAKGGVAAAFAAALHNLVDFNLAFGGVALPLAVAYAAAASVPRLPSAPVGGGPPAPEDPASGPAAEHGSLPPLAAKQPAGSLARWLEGLERLRLPRPLALGVAGAAALAALLSLWAAPQQAEQESASLAALARDPRVNAGEVLAAARVAVERHPADWLVSLAPALGLLQRTPPRTSEALAWAGRAQLLAPRAWRPHAVTAAVLARGGHRAQARIEARLGLSELSGSAYGEPLRVAASLCDTLEDTLEATPDDPAVRADLVRLLLEQGREPLALAVAETELRRLGDAPPPEVREAAARLRARRTWILLHRGQFALAAAEAAALPPGECLGPGLAARAAQGLGKPEAEVEQILLRGLVHCPGGSDLAYALVQGRLARGDAQGALRLLDDPTVGGPQVPWFADVHVWRAEALERLGRARESLREQWLAAVMAPTRIELGLRYAERLRASGDLGGALTALRRLAITAPEEGKAVLLDRAAEYEKQRTKQ